VPRQHLLQHFFQPKNAIFPSITKFSPPSTFSALTPTPTVIPLLFLHKEKKKPALRKPCPPLKQCSNFSNKIGYWTPFFSNAFFSYSNRK
jgi:hypothetical protein